MQTHAQHQLISRPREGDEGGGFEARIRQVWGHLGPCWVALGVGLVIHWATWGCHGQSLGT